MYLLREVLKSTGSPALNVTDASPPSINNPVPVPLTIFVVLLMFSATVALFVFKILSLTHIAVSQFVIVIPVIAYTLGPAFSVYPS